MEEKVVLVDSSDQPLGEAGKMWVHQEGVLHRAVSVFVFNSRKQLLLQKRALSKYHSPGLWTNTACTHPYPGENNRAAAVRRLKQEMNLTVDELTQLFSFTYHQPLDQGLTEHEFDHVFVGFSDHPPMPSPEEVADYRYVEVETLMQEVRDQPQEFTVWFKQIVGRVAEEVDRCW